MGRRHHYDKGGRYKGYSDDSGPGCAIGAVPAAILLLLFFQYWPFVLAAVVIAVVFYFVVMSDG